MCERCRQRFLYVKNRLEELASRHGALLEPPPEEVALMPTWGPVGSLAARLLTDEALEELFRLHRDMLQLERDRQGNHELGPKGVGW